MFSLFAVRPRLWSVKQAETENDAKEFMQKLEIFIKTHAYYHNDIFKSIIMVKFAVARQLTKTNDWLNAI